MSRVTKAPVALDPNDPPQGRKRKTRAVVSTATPILLTAFVQATVVMPGPDATASTVLTVPSVKVKSAAAQTPPTENPAGKATSMVSPTAKELLPDRLKLIWWAALLLFDWSDIWSLRLLTDAALINRMATEAATTTKKPSPRPKLSRCRWRLTISGCPFSL